MLRIPIQSKEFLRVAKVRASDNGTPVDPTLTIVKAAFFNSETTEPTAGDANWKTATWENDDGVYFVRCLVGTAGDFVPTAGVWYPWVKIDGSPELVIRPVDPVEFF